MLSIVPEPQLSISDIALLRTLLGLGIAEIKRAALTRSSIRDFHVFGSQWHDERLILSTVVSAYFRAAKPPFRFCESDDGGALEWLSPTEIKARLDHWRSIELATQLHTDLKTGSISTREDFVPHDEDWRPNLDE